MQQLLLYVTLICFSSVPCEQKHYDEEARDLILKSGEKQNDA